MKQEELLIELEEAFGRLSDGLSAVELMVMGLEDVGDPYTDGFYAVWRYLDKSREEVRKLLAAVSTLRAAA